MNHNLDLILDFLNNYNLNNVCIQNIDSIIDDKKSVGFYQYLIENYDNCSDIYIETANITRKQSIIRTRINGGIVSKIGTIENYNLAHIDDNYFNITNIIEKINNQQNDDIIFMFYVPLKGIYRIRSMVSGGDFFARIIKLHAFKTDNHQINSIQKNMNFTSVNEFNIQLLDKEMNVEINHFNLKTLNYATPYSYFKSNNELFDVHTLISTNVHDFKFICCPMFNKDNNGIWHITLVYKIYIFSENLELLLTFFEKHKSLFKNPFLKNFYQAASDMINAIYNTTQIVIDENTNMDEVRTIIKTLEY